MSDSSSTQVVRPYGDELKLVLSQDLTERERADRMRRDFIATAVTATAASAPNDPASPARRKVFCGAGSFSRSALNCGCSCIAVMRYGCTL